MDPNQRLVTFRRIFCKRLARQPGNARRVGKTCNAAVWYCSFTSNRKRLFFVVDNGSSHGGKASIQRMKKKDKRIILLHTPVHASWLNQVEIYFSIVQRKVLTPNDFPDLAAVRTRLALYEELSNRTPKPFQWKFTRKSLESWLQRIKPHFPDLATRSRRPDKPGHYL